MISASCHCGSIQITLDQKPHTLTECNCSICRRYAALWAFYTPDSVQVSFSAELTTIYAWGEKRFEYYRCNRCGCVTHNLKSNQSKDNRIAVNARMMAPADILDIEIRLFDGANTWKYFDE